VGEDDLDLLMDVFVVPGGGGDELLQGVNPAIAEGQRDGLGVLAALVQQQATQVGKGMLLCRPGAEQGSETLVHLLQVRRRCAYLVRRHEGVLLTLSIFLCPDDQRAFVVFSYCKWRSI
jgi:hypothetical protein